MSLLNRGTETVTVYPETVVTDEDGNTLTRPGPIGVLARAVVQPLSSTETDQVTTSKYRLRLVGYPALLGAQSQIEWSGKRYAIDGDPLIYNGSPRTARAEYVMVRN